MPCLFINAFTLRLSPERSQVMILPPLALDLGLLLISIGVVNVWRARFISGD
tara:strand:- start:380 stop:535 length:156 start_codon:yes stop_codon:yes gene_type:complete